ncbi:MAG: 30S ribosomal protein S20 [Actinomycetota bacterium]
MANIKSQKKRILTNEKARLRNVAERSRLRTLRRRFRETLTAGDLDAADKALGEVKQAYDKAASKGLVHKNNAANHKSKLTKELNAAKQA